MESLEVEGERLYVKGEPETRGRHVEGDGQGDIQMAEPFDKEWMTGLFDCLSFEGQWVIEDAEICEYGGQKILKQDFLMFCIRRF